MQMCMVDHFFLITLCLVLLVIECFQEIPGTILIPNFDVLSLSDTVCPLKFPNITTVSEECEGLINDRTDCCKAVEGYVSHLQEQSFLTNLQALNCATYLGIKLQQANISKNLYNLCHINLKDFSLQGQQVLFLSLFFPCCG